MKNNKLETKRYLILDFDGVCNSYEDGSYVTNDNETYGPSEKICRRIRRICENANARVVISSTWRKFDEDGYAVVNGKRIQNPLNKLKEKIGDLIDGTIPTDRCLSKVEALILWIEDQKDLDNWVVLDDDPDENFGTTCDYGIKNHYIQTNPEFGLDEVTEEKTLTILTHGV